MATLDHGYESRISLTQDYDPALTFAEQAKIPPTWTVTVTTVFRNEQDARDYYIKRSDQGES